MSNVDELARTVKEAFIISARASRSCADDLPRTWSRPRQSLSIRAQWTSPRTAYGQGSHFRPSNGTADLIAEAERPVIYAAVGEYGRAHEELRILAEMMKCPLP